MAFKVLGSLTNVRSVKTEEALIETTPTKGNIKLNANAASKMGVTKGDYLAIVPAADVDEKGNPIAGTEQIFLTRGTAGSEDGKVKQAGSILSGKAGGSLLCSSENAWKEMGGNSLNKCSFNVGDGQTFDGDSNTYYKLTFVGEIAKSVRKKADKAVEA